MQCINLPHQQALTDWPFSFKLGQSKITLVLFWLWDYYIYYSVS